MGKRISRGFNRPLESKIKHRSKELEKGQFTIDVRKKYILGKVVDIAVSNGYDSELESVKAKVVYVHPKGRFATAISP